MNLMRETAESARRRWSTTRRGQLKLAASFGALTGASLLAACGAQGGASGSAGQGGTSGSAGPVKITWFAGRDTSGYTPKSVEAFNAQSQPIKIDYQEIGSNTQDLHDRFVTTATAKDSAADLISMDVPYVPEFAAAGWTSAVEELLPSAERSKFFKGTLEGATYSGKLYAVPWYNNGPGLFYRKDLLQGAGLQPPKTYDELLNAAKRLQTADVAGFIAQTSQTEGGMITWLEYLWGYGGDVTDEKMAVVVDKGTAGLDAMRRLVSFMYTDKIMPESTLSMRVGADAQNVFTEGRAVFMRFWMTGASAMEAAESKVKGQWDVTTLPSQTGRPGPGCLGTWNLGISKFSKYPKESAEAIKFLTGLEQQKARYLGNGSLPARAAVFDDAEVKAKYPFADRLKASFESLKARPVTPYYPTMSADALQPNFGAAISRQKSPEQAIKDMADKLRTIVKG